MSSRRSCSKALAGRKLASAVAPQPPPAELAGRPATRIRRPGEPPAHTRGRRLRYAQAGVSVWPIAAGLGLRLLVRIVLCAATVSSAQQAALSYDFRLLLLGSSALQQIGVNMSGALRSAIRVVRQLRPPKSGGDPGHPAAGLFQCDALNLIAQIGIAVCAGPGICFRAEAVTALGRCALQPHSA